MAEEKMKNNTEVTKREDRPVKPNRLVEAFMKDYKYEGLILLILALIALILGILIYKGETSDGASGLVVNSGVFLIGDYPLVFAWILIILGAFSLILSIWPYYKPSVYEVKRVSWPNKKTMLENCITTFIFVVVFTLFFTLVDAGLGAFIDYAIKPMAEWFN